MQTEIRMPALVREMTASFYESSRGPLTDGSRFHADGMFCAADNMSMGTRVRLKGPSGRTVQVQVRDFGPAFDLSPRAFALLAGPGWRRLGRIPVTYTITGHAPHIPKHRHRRGAR